MMNGVAGRITEWVRPHVPEASDGILTSAGICEGFAGAGVGTMVPIFAGFAGLVAGTLAAGAIEYSKLGAERDQRVAEMTSERVQLETAPDAELDELTQLYGSRGLSRSLARQVAIELTAHDPLAAHAEAECGPSFPVGPYAIDGGGIHPDQMRRYPLEPRLEPGIDERRALGIGIQMMCRPPHQHDPPLAYLRIDLVGLHGDLAVGVLNASA
jgi:hypothetical protein